MRTKRITAIAVTMALACTGCTVAADKAGGESDAVTLTFGNPYSHLDYVPQVEAFVDAVERVSGGAIAIQLEDEWGGLAPGFEAAAIEAVADGEIDLAWVGTRAFDLVGETALQSLTAPFLVDSHELQRAVLNGDLSRRMMDAVDIDGLEPLALLAGGLRRPFSVDAPLTSSAAFEGITFQSFESALNAESTAALGAIPQHATPDGLDADLASGATQGFEKQLSTVLINGTQRLAPYLAFNVVLWPETIAIIGSADRLSQLSGRQRAWLADAAAEASRSSVAALPDDAEGLEIYCAGGARAALATQADLASLRAAVDPVYADLREDAATSRFLDEIAALKEQTSHIELTVPADCRGAAAIPQTDSSSADPDAEAIEGVYRWELTAEAFEAAGLREDQRYPWPHTFTMTLVDGKWEHNVRDARQAADYPSGHYTVDGDELVLTWDASGFPMSFTFVQEANGNLRLTPAPSLSKEDAFVIASQEWVRIR